MYDRYMTNRVQALTAEVDRLAEIADGQLRTEADNPGMTHAVKRTNEAIDQLTAARTKLARYLNAH